MAAPQTPFEARGRSMPWTTVQEETAWLDAMTAYTPMFTVETRGLSPEGRPVRLIKAGTGPLTILHVAQQHGEELSGREAIFTTMRQWADSTDPDLADYLSQVTVLFMPSCNPDTHEVRQNVNGVNLNRDHIQLTQPETQAIHSVIRDYVPDVICDWHEGTNISTNYASSPAFNLNADGEVKAASEELSNVARDAILGGGWTWEVYQPGNTMKGPENLCNNAAIQNRVSVLLETKRFPNIETPVAVQLRHDMALTVMAAITDWHHASATDLHALVLAADARIADRQGTFTFHVGTDDTGPQTSIPYGYLLNSAQRDATQTLRGLFRITGHQEPGGYMVECGQAQQSVIGYALDPSSSRNTVAAQRILTPPDPGAPDAEPHRGGKVLDMKFGLGGLVYNVVGGKVRQDGQVHTMRLPDQ